MVVLNRMSRYHLVLEALRRSRRVPESGTELAEHCQAMLARHHGYIREHFEDMPEVRDWTWTRDRLDAPAGMVLALNPGSSCLKAVLCDPAPVLAVGDRTARHRPGPLDRHRRPGTAPARDRSPATCPPRSPSSPSC